MKHWQKKGYLVFLVLVLGIFLFLNQRGDIQPKKEDLPSGLGQIKEQEQKAPSEKAQAKTSSEEKSKEKAKPAQEEAPQFRSVKLLDAHYEKHVIKQKEFGDISKDEYLAGAQALITGKEADILSKKEADGDLLFYREKTNEFAVLSKDGYIRTYFKPERGISYYEDQ